MIQDMNVNDLPSCNTYASAVYRLVEEDYPDMEHGRAQLDEDGRLFVKVAGVAIEFEVKGSSITKIGLRDQASTSMGEMGEYVGDPSPVESSSSPDEPIASVPEYMEVFPSINSADESQVVLPDGEVAAPGTTSIPEILPGASSSSSSVPEGSDVPAESDSPELVLDIPDSNITGDADEIRTRINAFFSNLSIPAQLTFRRFLDTRPIWAEVSSVTRTQLKGKVQGAVYSYDITIYDDGSIEIPDAAWVEFPQWLGFKREG